MASLWHVLFFSLIGSVISLIGGLLLFSNRTQAHRLAVYATPFAAGALLAAAFVDLLKEAAHTGNIETALTWTMLGILFFFVLERFLHWFHHHHEHKSAKRDPATVLIIIGDTLHNFIDGIAIAAAFLVSIPTGIIATIAVAAHEIPQEIGDFGLLLKKGMSRKGVVKVNVISALATVIAATSFFRLGQDFNVSLDVVVGLIAGFFIYIAVSDIIPSIHESEEDVIAGPQTIMLLVGVIVVSLLTTTLHGYIDAQSSKSHGLEVIDQKYDRTEDHHHGEDAPAHEH